MMLRPNACHTSLQSQPYLLSSFIKVISPLRNSSQLLRCILIPYPTVHMKTLLRIRDCKLQGQLPIDLENSI